MTRLTPRLLGLFIAISAVLPGAALGAQPDPKVVVIVGPVGEATGRYLARGEAAAREAERFTSNVVRVFTPNATWPAVRHALQGASMVVYLGHGNGWPSHYRNELYRPTQNGFGLNPFAGAGDDVHQYFGEGRISAEVALAKNAVVILGHLCYASGNTEPGLPEGTQHEARQRVDNYAAGFIAAGASAVLADGELSPAWYVRSILGGKRSVERIWQASPSRNGNTFTFESRRSPGFVAAMDPDRPSGGYYRSLVIRSGLRAADVAAGATVAAPASVAVPEPADPTLVGTGLTLDTPYIKGRLLAGADAALWIPYTVPESAAEPAMTVAVRWDPIDVVEEAPADSAAPPAAPDQTSQPAASSEPESTAEPSAEPDAEASAEPDAEASAEPRPPADLSGDPFAAPADAPPVATDSDPPASAPQPPVEEELRLSLVEPERIGSVVEPVKAGAGPTRITVPLKLPQTPGRYRLALTLHDRSGVAYDAASQALLPGLLVRISGDVAAEYLVPSTLRVVAGQPFDLRAGVVNTGATTWGRAAPTGRTVRAGEGPLHAALAAHWVSLGSAGEPLGDVTVALPAGVKGGATVRTTLEGVAPEAPGQYLLVLDVVDPQLGSLAAHGVKPALVRVTVEAAAD